MEYGRKGTISSPYAFHGALYMCRLDSYFYAYPRNFISVSSDLDISFMVPNKYYYRWKNVSTLDETVFMVIQMILQKTLTISRFFKYFELNNFQNVFTASIIHLSTWL